MEAEISREFFSPSPLAKAKKNPKMPLPTALRKLTANDKNLEVFSIEKRKYFFIYEIQLSLVLKESEWFLY
jgi:hypothetical protein